MNWASFLPGLKEFVLPVATFFLSVAVGVVAWLQWHVARTKLRLDLFDRRYKIYEATRTFLKLILRGTALSESELAEADLAFSEAVFLFGSDVSEFLREIREQARHLPYDRSGEAVHQRIAWMNKQLTAMREVFGRYLGFGQVK
jgi:hypothetical protein